MLLQRLIRCLLTVTWSVQVSARNAVVDVIERVFEVHGAVPMDSSDVGFCPIDAPADIAAMLSTSGARLAMRQAHLSLHLHSTQQSPGPLFLPLCMKSVRE